MTTNTSAALTIDMERYRLRRFVDRLIDLGEVEIHDRPVPLAGLAAVIEGTRNAVLFKKAGPEQAEIVAKTAGSRRRVAAACISTPTRRGRTLSCARAASGHASAAPPSRAINSRRCNRCNGILFLCRKPMQQAYGASRSAVVMSLTVLTWCRGGV